MPIIILVVGMHTVAHFIVGDLTPCVGTMGLPQKLVVMVDFGKASRNGVLAFFNRVTAGISHPFDTKWESV